MPRSSRARFRLFGRTPATHPAGPGAPAPGPFPYGPPAAGWGAATPAGPPPVGAGVPWPGGPATRFARPAVSADPPTDPYGFPPVPGGPAAVLPDRCAPPAPDPAEAAALAGAFAVDYLSWDEDDPGRRGRVLLDHLSVAGSDPARLGWSGQGRQRAEFALPGRQQPDGEGRVLVDVRVRVTPYRAVGERPGGAGEEPDPCVTGVPAAAPAPTGRGWRSLASCWIRLSVPVVLEGGRLVVDAWDETLGEEQAVLPRPAPAASTADDHSLADDDPLAEPQRGGAW